MTAAAWHPDPTGRHELRYWDGNQWTEHVSDQGVQAVSPLTPPDEPGGAHRAEDASGGAVSSDQTSEPAADPLTSEQPPADALSSEPAVEEPAAEEQPAAQQPPAYEPLAEQAPSYEPAQPSQPAAQPSYQPEPTPYAQQPAAQAPYAQQAQQPYGGGAPAGAAGISGDLISGQFAESSSTAPGPSLQNAKLLRVRMVGEPFMARQGSMVAYQGQVSFNYQGGGAGKFLKKALTGEGLSLMRVEGQGDVFIADAAANVHILHLNNSGISVNGSNVLAFSSSLDWNIERVKGGSIAAGGLFNTTLRGTGWVAITTDGDPVVLNPAEAPTFADTNAIVAWSVDLQTSLQTSFKASALIGRGSGEAIQVTFAGQGFVIVQPSEGAVVPPHTH